MQAAAPPDSLDEALAMIHAGLDHLNNGVDWRSPGSAAQARALQSLQAASAKWSVAHGEGLRAIAASGGYAIDGHTDVRAWLRHSCRQTREAARKLHLWEKTLKEHPLLRDALAEGGISESWAGQFAAWNDRLPGAEIDKADAILLGAARDGLLLRPDIARIAQAIYEAVMGQLPSPDDGDGGRDRDLRMATTIGGAGKLHGDLSPQCAALLEKVLAAFGRPVGPDDLRTVGERNHDALETALRLSLGTPDVPQSAGMKTQGLVIMTLADLLRMDGASVLVNEWLAAQDGQPRNALLTARAGETGWLSGGDAAAAGCAAHITPVVTGAPDWDVISQMADVFLDAHGLGGHGPGRHDAPLRTTSDGDQGTRDHGGEQGTRAGTGSADASGPSHSCRCTCGGCNCLPAGLRGPLSPVARVALEQTLLRMAIRALSGPEGLAGYLRAHLLGRPFNGASLPLNVGQTDHIPDYLRRAVSLRDPHCQWPGGCDRPASQCEPHHVVPRSAGGETSLRNLTNLCLAHHHHYIHRIGWKLTAHPDGTTTAIAPWGTTLHSHGPRTSQSASGHGPSARKPPARRRPTRPGGTGTPVTTGPSKTGPPGTARPGNRGSANSQGPPGSHAT